MTDTLTKLKTSLGILDSKDDSLLIDILSESETLITLYVDESNEPLKDTLIPIQIGVAKNIYNKQGEEGYNSTSIGGNSYSYQDNVLTDYIPILDKYRESKRVKWRFY